MKQKRFNAASDGSHFHRFHFVLRFNNATQQQQQRFFEGLKTLQANDVRTTGFANINTTVFISTRRRHTTNLSLIEIVIDNSEHSGEG